MTVMLHTASVTQRLQLILLLLLHLIIITDY